MALLSCNDQDIMGRAGRIARLLDAQHPELVAELGDVDLRQIADTLERIEQLNHRARLAAAGGR